MRSRLRSARTLLSLATLGWVAAPAATATPTAGPAAESASAAAPAGPTAPLSFNEHVQPILWENCYHCHGPDSSTREAGLRLDRRDDAVTARGDYDPAIIPGNPAASPLIERILSTDPEDQMPPPETHKTLKPHEIEILQRWVKEGAPYQPHWSLIAPTRPAVPAAGEGWARSPIDAFIAARLDREGLKPSTPEPPARLLRRVTLDLTGLPPTPDELAAFLADPSGAAYTRAVDRLLTSDAHAEHMARQWLDAARYADTHGIHIDNYRSIWPYRDWVISAYQQNLPFDQFSIEQLAGDLLPEPTLEQRVATGFNRCLPTTSEGGAIAAEYEAIYAKDRVETFSTVWLGLTTSCAACHDHKFDPVTMRDFYSLAAFFRNNTMPAMDGNIAETKPNVFVPVPEDRAAWAELDAQISGLERTLADRRAAGETDFARWVAGATVTDLRPAPLDHRTAIHLPLDGTDGIAPLARFAGLPENGRATAPTTSAPAAAPAAGPFGPATRIDGQSVSLGRELPMLQSSQFSVRFLIRVEGAPSGTVLSARTEDDTAPGWEVFLEDGKPALFISEGNGAPPLRTVNKNPLKPGEWHEMLFVFDGTGSHFRLGHLHVSGYKLIDTGILRMFRSDIRPAAGLRLGGREVRAGADENLIKGGAVWLQDFRQLDRVFSHEDAMLESRSIVSTLTSLQKPADQRQKDDLKPLRDHFFAAVDPTSRELIAAIEQHRATARPMRDRGAVSLVMVEKTDSTPHAHIFKRGEYSQPGERVEANTPEALPPLPAGTAANRLALARWLFQPDHPLTARVTVNRTWQQLFGTGLVESTGDFGITGSRPSHPELLDWLAVDFRENGWDHRRLLRQLVTSATYRQSAAVSPSLLERDPANRLLARGPRHRLDAEVLRDQALAASNLLVQRIGGRPVKPYQPDSIWEDVAMKESTTRFYQRDQGEALYRRSLYTFWKRTAPHPALEILNAPSRETACVRRDRTNTPLQALVVQNDPIFVESSRQLAAAALRAAGTFDGRLDFITVRLLGRRLAHDERGVVQGFVTSARETYGAKPALAADLLRVGDSSVDPSLPPVELAAWALAASQMMNLDESLTK
jgi:cytochrome c553